jgi:hypothetical protein
MALLLRENVGPGFEHLLPRLDNDDREFYVSVEFGRDGWSAKVDQRNDQAVPSVTVQYRRFSYIERPPYYKTADAGQYFALLDFMAAGQYRRVSLYQNPPATTAPPPPGTHAMMEHILTSIIANQQPVAAQFIIRDLSLTIQSLDLALQYPDVVTLVRCRMVESPLQLVPRVADQHPAAAAALRDSPERGSTLRISSINDWRGILQAATRLQTNVTSLQLYLNFTDPIVGRLDLSSVIGFVANQPNSVHLSLTFYRSSGIDAVVLVETIVADISTQCPGVHSLEIDVYSLLIDPRTPPLMPEQFPRLMAHVSDSALARLEFVPTVFLNPTQEQQIAVLIQRNRAIPEYLKTTQLLKQRNEVAVDPNDPPIMIYVDYGEFEEVPAPVEPPIVVYNDDDAADRSKHQFVLSHALCQAAVHPIFFSHFYQFVRDHAEDLPGGEKGRRPQQPPPHRRRRSAPAAAAAAQPPP